MRTPGSSATVLRYFIASPYGGPTFKIRATSLYSIPYNLQLSGFKLFGKVFRFCHSTIQQMGSFLKFKLITNLNKLTIKIIICIEHKNLHFSIFITDSIQLILSAHFQMGNSILYPHDGRRGSWGCSGTAA